MKRSQSFVRTRKDYPKDEVSISSQLLIRAGFVDKVAAGVYTLLPLGLKVANKISDIIRDEMDMAGGQEVLMPGLIPKDALVTTDRWDNFDALFKIKGQDEKEYAMGATHEEIVSPLAKKFTLSYKDLPFAIYQIQNKFRNEVRAKSGVLRTREFLMKDLYSFHTDEADLDKYYDVMTKSYWNIWERVGIKDKTYFVYASGGAFSKYSHEFQTETESGEDEIYVCSKCGVGLNKEILEGEYKCPSCGQSEYEIKKMVEVGNIFKLMTKFSAPFDLSFVDKDDKKKPVIMGCYGIGIQRLMGTVAEISHDEKGLIWPEEIAPAKYYLIATQEKKPEAEKLYEKMTKDGIEVIYDDREEVSMGEKFADADLAGIPYRLVLSDKAGDQVEIKNRQTGEIELKDLDSIK